MTTTHDAKVMADGAAVVVGLGGFLGWMTPVVTLIGGVLTIVWLSIRIWETDTVKGLVAKYAKHE
jgi:Flp pilus assembly protein protease CpaA